MCGQGCLYTQYCRLDNSFLGAFGPHKPHLGILGVCWYILSPLLVEKRLEQEILGHFLLNRRAKKWLFSPFPLIPTTFLVFFWAPNVPTDLARVYLARLGPVLMITGKKIGQKGPNLAILSHFRPFLQFGPTLGGSKCMNRRSVGKTALVTNPPRFGEPVEPLNSFSIVGPNVCVESHCVCCWLYTQWL